MNDAQLVEEVDEVVETPEAEAEDVEVTEDTTDATGDEESPAESSSEKSEDEVKQDKVQKRIDEITRFRREEERQRIRAEQENEQLKQQLEQLKPKQPPGRTLADFEYDEGRYQDYLTEQATDRARAMVQEQIRIEREQSIQADFSIKESDYASEHDDYYTAVQNPSLHLTQDMVNVARGSEQGPAILHHLAKNPDQSERLARMSPLDMARELGRIEASDLVKKPPSISKAPSPAPKLAAAAKSSTIRSDSPDSDSLSVEEWRRREHKRLANRK